MKQTVPAIGFVLDPSAPWPSDRNDLSSNLDAFKEKLEKLKKKLVSFWKSGDDLSGKVVIALTKLMTERPRPELGAGVGSAYYRCTQRIVEVEQGKPRASQGADEAWPRAAYCRSTYFTEKEDSFGNPPIQTSVASILFRAVGRELTVEAEASSIARTFRLSSEVTDEENKAVLAEGIRGIPEWLLDLALLDLVASRTERFLNANGAYTARDFWQLTSFGKKTLMRRIALAPQTRPAQRSGLAILSAPKNPHRSYRNFYY